MRRTTARAPRKILAAIATGALALGAVVAAPTAAQAAEVQVDDVTFTWGINPETHAAAFAPGTYNLVSAGVVGMTAVTDRVTTSNWKQSEGDVSIFKTQADGSLAPATFAGLRTDANGTTTTTGNGLNAGSVVEIADGSGTIDADAGTASIQWTGTFTVAYYSGMTRFWVQDPKLSVAADGTGTVTATLGGWGTSMDDPEKFETLTPVPNVPIATLSNVDVDADGFTVTPDYLGVTNTEADQVKTGAVWGSFPQAFVDFQKFTGQTQYWYSSGGQADRRKPVLPLSVSYDLPTPVSIVSQPTAQSVSLGQDATFSVVAEGAESYQWQSAPAGSTNFTSVADATSAQLVVAGTTANAKDYRVVVSGAGPAVTSDAVSLTVSVPTPTVTVSKSAALDPAGEQITVTGTGFLANPPATNGAAQRGPLAGVFSGAYVAFGKFADTWKPSQGAASSARKTDPDAVRWGIHSEQFPLVGGAAAGAVEIAKDGTFEITLTVRKGFTGEPATGNYGIYTYPGGSSGYSAFETYTPITFAIPAPAAPAAPTATLGEDGTSIDVSWTAPADNGSAITGYDVTLTPASGDPIVKTAAAGETSVAFAGLTRGASYTASVVAKNAGGSSAASPVSDAVEVPALAPAAPATPTLTPSTTSIAVAWAAPAANGSAITGYTVTVRAGGEVVTTKPVAADATTTTVDGLARGTAYAVTVTATNGVGSSDPSAAATTTTLAEAPDAVTAPVATLSGPRAINVAWVAPESDGGSAITGYVVRLYAGDEVVAEQPAGADSLSTTFSYQRAGTDFTATVAAVNAEAESAQSPRSNAITTWAAPTAPAASLALVDGELVATWEEPTDLGGGPVTSYSVSVLENGEGVQSYGPIDPAERSLVIGYDLVPGATYTVEVLATNAADSSTATVTNAVTIPVQASVPGAPASTSLVAGADGSSATLSWSAPTRDGGAAITGYTVGLFAFDEAGQETFEPILDTVGADVRSYTFTDLPKGDFVAGILAANEIGAGDVATTTAVSLAGAAPKTQPTLLTDAELNLQKFGPGTITVEGGTTKIELGADHANQWVGVAVNSDPVWLGWFLTDAAGTVTVTLPSTLAAGAHHVVVYAADGSLLAYQGFSIAAAAAGSSSPISSGLAATGSDAATLWPLAGFGFLVLAAGAALVIRRRMVGAQG